VLIIGLMRAVFSVLDWVSNIFPAVNTSSWTAWLPAVKNIYATVIQVDSAFPVHEFIDAMGVYFAVWLALNGGNVIRKIWMTVKW